MIVPKYYLESKIQPLIVQKCNASKSVFIDKFNEYIENKPSATFQQALEHCNVRNIEFYLDRFKKTDFIGDSALGVAASVGNYPVIMAIAAITTHHLNTGNYDRLTPLHLAAKVINPQLSYLTTLCLLRLGAKVNVISKTEFTSRWDYFPLCVTPLTEAVSVNNVAAAVLLLRHGTRMDWMEDNLEFNYARSNFIYKNIQKARYYSVTDNEKLLLLAKVKQGSLFDLLNEDVISIILNRMLLVSWTDDGDIRNHLVRHKFLAPHEK